MNSAKFLVEGVYKVMVMSLFLGRDSHTQVVFSSLITSNFEIR